MAALRALLACLVLAALVSGCASDGTSGTAPAPDDAMPPPGSEEEPAASADEGDEDGQADEGPADPAPEGLASAAEPCDAPPAHGDPRRDDGTVDTAPEGAQFVARRTITIDNDFGGAERSRLLLKSFNGAIAVAASTDCGYRLVAELYGRGATQDDARQALDLLTLTATDDLGQGALSLSFVLTSGTPDAVPLPIGLPTGVQNGARLQMSVPPGPAHDLEAETSNALIAVERLHGPRVKATSSNAGLSIEGSFGEAELGTSNAGISLKGTFDDVVAGTSNAGVSADLQPARSGKVRLTTSNAGIAVDLPRDEAAFDITGDTSNGKVFFDLEGRETDEDAHGTFRSGDWSSASVQVTMELSASNASISVQD